MTGVTGVLAAASPIARAPTMTAAAATVIVLLVGQTCVREDLTTGEAANLPGGREALGMIVGSRLTLAGVTIGRVRPMHREMV